EAAVAGKGDHLSIRECLLRADRLSHGVGHGAVPERSEEPALAVHGEIARRPDRGQADIAGEDRISRGAIAKRRGDLFRVNDAFAPRASCEIVQLPARLGVVPPGLGKMRTIAFRLKPRQERLKRCPDITDDAEVYCGAAAEMLRSEIDLSDAHAAALRIELPIWKIGPDHQQNVAVEHRIIA